MEMLKGVKDKSGATHGFGFTELAVPYISYDDGDNAPLFLLTFLNAIQQALMGGEVEVRVETNNESIENELKCVKERGCYTTIPDPTHPLDASNNNKYNLQFDFIVGITPSTINSSITNLCFHFLDPMSRTVVNSLVDAAKGINNRVDGNLYITLGNGYYRVSLIPVSYNT